MAQDNERVTNREDEEIELMDYLIVLWKRKWLIVVGTFICLITAGMVAFNMTKIYEASTSINVGRIEGRFVEEGSIISERVKSISLRKEIGQKLSLPLKEISGKEFFKVSTKENRDTLTVEIKRETAKPDQAIKILEIVNENIIHDHKGRIEKAKKTLLDKIVISESRIIVTETQIEALKKELSDKIAINEKLIEIKKQKQNVLEKQLADTEKEIRNLEEIRDDIVRRKLKEVDVVGMVAYFNDLQARLNSAYSTRSQIVDEIPSQIQSYRVDITALQARLTNLNGLPLKIESYKEDIATLQAKLNEIRETEIIDSPHSSYYPVKPQKKRILAIAAVLGFIVCVFLAFFFEYIERYRERKVKTE